MLTPKDKKIFSFIQEYMEASGYAPTLEEVRGHFGYKSLTSVQRSIWSLERQGYLKRDKHQNRGIKLISKQSEVYNIPLVGSVPCGQPLLAVENIEGYIQTDIGFVKGEPSSFFYLTATGDSMNLAGIDEGDLILVRKQAEARNGDLVVVLLDDKATIKKFYRARDYVKLKPCSANALHKPIILRKDFEIQGVVVRVFKE